MWIMIVIEGGSFRYKIGKNQGIAQKGDLVLCPPGTVFKREMLQPLSFLILTFTWHTLSGEEVVDETGLIPNPAGKCMIRDKQRFASTVQYLKILKRRKDPLSESRRNFLLQDIWQQYSWEWETELRHLAVVTDPLMEKAEGALKESAFKPFNLSQLSSELGLSTVQFSRRFRKRYGMNPSEYVSELRLDKARLLLQETKMTLEDIALHCGYSSGFYFSRVFTNKMQLSPSEYRQAHRV